jgi:hypothetical protein
MVKRNLAYWILAFSLVALLLSCEKEKLSFTDIQQKTYYNSEIFDSSYLHVYGKWDRDGGSYGQLFQALEFRQFGIYAIHSDSVILEFGRIEIIEQNEKSLLTKLVQDGSSPYYFGEREFYFSFFGLDTLYIGAPCCDRAWYRLIRAK